MQVKCIITMMHVGVPFTLPVFVSIYTHPLVAEQHFLGGCTTCVQNCDLYN